MTSRSVLSVAICLAAMLSVSFSQNCSNTDCVEIAKDLHAAGPDKGKNKRCVLTVYNQTNKEFGGLAYSDQYAHDDCYGKVSKNGDPDTPVEGHRYTCAGTSDCAPQTILPVSGSVTAYGLGPFNITFDSECNKKGS